MICIDFRASVVMVNYLRPTEVRAFFRNSSVVFIEQNFGPHMLQ